jgi:hypothetical protein
MTYAHFGARAGARTIGATSFEFATSAILADEAARHRSELRIVVNHMKPIIPLPQVNPDPAFSTCSQV